MKKVFGIMMSALMILSIFATSACSVKTSCAEIETAIKNAIGEENYLCNTRIDTAELIENYSLDSTKIIDCVGYENNITSLNPDRVIIFQCEDGYQEVVIQQINDAYENLISYIRLYPFVLEKGEQARLYQSGEYVAFILAGANMEGYDATDEEEAEFVANEYAKIDAAWEGIFGKVPENRLIVPEAKSNSGTGGAFVLDGDLLGS